MESTDLRFTNHDWSALAEQIDERGFARIENLLTASQCSELREYYDEPERFRSKVVMQRHSFGQGEYQYFNYPLPDLVSEMRHQLYAPLAPIANVWNERLRHSERFPNDLAALTEHCHQRGQNRPTPLILKYGPGDYNRLHQDLYGEMVFPLQLTVLLSQPDIDFSGGEFVLTEQKPRMQSRVQVVPLHQGDAVIFAVNERPVSSVRGWSRARMRHGVSEIISGHRVTLGLIFHDAA
jgi:hypothetical protein